MNVRDGVAVCENDGHFSPLNSRHFTYGALSRTPRDALATASVFFTSSERCTFRHTPVARNCLCQRQIL
jgi:hypothetical protein